MPLPLPDFHLVSAALKRLCLLLGLLGLSPAARAANYYWVGNSGTWTDLSHWASSSGGAGNAYTNVPKNTDNVYFDASSFVTTNQRVAIVGTVTCNDMTWSGNVRQATLLQSTNGVLEINGDLRYTASMATALAIAVPHRLLAAATGAVVDMQGVPFGAALTFDNAAGGWTFTSAFNGTSGTVLNISAAHLVSFGSATLTFSTLNTYSGSTQVASTGAGTLDLGSSTTTLLVQTSTGALNLLNPNLALTAGTSTLNVGASVLTTYTSPVSINTSRPLTFNKVVINTGSGAVFSVANSSFTTLIVNSRLTLGSAATISAGGSLALGADATLLVGAGTTKVLSFGSGATLATAGSCAGFGTVQSTQTGSPAILARSGGWASAGLSYAVLQDLTFSDGSSGYPANGAATATASADQGGNSGITLSGLPTTDLYWVGGTGTWHDASHWASTSGGAAGGTGCVPNVFTNVYFDAKSFAAPSQVVTLDLAGQACRNMDWTGVANKPTVSAPARRALTVAGSLTLAGPASMTQTLAIDLFLGQPQAGGSHALTTAGQPLAAHLWFRPAGGSYALLDDVTTSGRVFVESGTFNTNDHTVNAQSFSSGYVFNGSIYSTGTVQGSPVSLLPPTVNLGTSVLNLLGTNTRNESNVLTTNYAWDVASVVVGGVAATPVTLNAGSSTINMLNGNNANSYYSFFRGALGLTYGTVSFANNTSGVSPNIIGAIGSTSTFQNLLFYGLATIGSNNIIKGQLLLTPGKTYLFTNAITQTFTSEATLNAQGTCSNFITITGPATAAATRFISASNAPLQYVALQYTAFSGGATWLDQGGVDNGTNTGITITGGLPARTLYWVGGTGSWSNAAHWSLSSGGAAGECSPSLIDNVVVDASSCPATGQTLTIDLASANCRSLDCSAATNGMTLSSILGSQLGVYGSVTWAPTPSMTVALAGGLSLLGPGTASTLTSAGQLLTGTLTLNVPSGGVTLADNFASIAGIAHTAGTFTTNDQTISALSYATSTSTAKALRLGASQLTINGAWNAPSTTGLTVTPGTSLLTVNSNAFNGAGQPYNDVVLNSPLSALTLSSNNTFHNLQLAGSANILGSNTIDGTLTFAAGRAYVFTPGTTTTFGPSATLVSVGLSNNPVTLQSAVNGSLFTWTKAAGGICADYTYIRDSRATGGAYFEAGRNGANNQGNNPGWSFGFLPRASYANRTTCPAEGPHFLRIDFTAYDGTNNVSGLSLATAQYPLTLRVANLTAGTYEDVSALATPYYYPIASSSATTQYQVITLATSATSGCGATSTTDLSTFPVVTDAILAGPHGTWSGNSAVADGNWLDCHNWASGAVPTSTTDVAINPNATSVSLGNSLTASVPVQPTLNGAGAAVHTLTTPAGATFTLGSSGQLAVAGDWVNNGTVTADPASQVTFQGSSAQTLTAGNFGSVVVSNTAGLALATDASTSGNLVLTAGTVTTGANKWVHTNGSAASLSGYSARSYVVGTLRRAIASNVAGTYAFPVGTASQYALYELVDHNLRGTGFGTIDARFGPKPGTDTNLNYQEPGTSLSYHAIHSAGVWTLTPSAQPSAGTYDAKVSLLPFSSLADNYFAILKRPDASTDAADWAAAGGVLSPVGGLGRLLAAGYALRLGLSSFSQFGVGQATAPLPVVLTSFRATAGGTCGVRLDWATASEAQSDRFEVERSADGRSFVPLATIASRNSAGGGTYSYLDQQPGEGLNYYRLKLMDQDQTSTYSPVATLTVACGAGGPVALAPNPATSTVHLPGLRAGQTLHVYGNDGRLVYAGPATGPDQPLDVSGWATGLYLVHIRNADGGLAGTCKLLKQ